MLLQHLHAIRAFNLVTAIKIILVKLLYQPTVVAEEDQVGRIREASKEKEVAPTRTLSQKVKITIEVTK